MRACVLSRFSCVQLFATPWTVAHQAPLFMGILQARTLKWVAIPFSRDQTRVSCLLDWQAGSIPLGPPGKLKEF